MDLKLKTIIEIFRKQVLVTLKDGRQIQGLITSQSHHEQDKEKIIRISILETKPFGVPVSVFTKDIEKLELLDEPNPFLNIEEV